MRRSLVIVLSFTIGLSAAPALGATTATVRISASAYHPKLAKTKVGRSITWKNFDGVRHSATSDVRGFFNTGVLMPPGSKATETMVAAGTFAYHCVIHPSMHGTVRVRFGLSTGSTTVGTAITLMAASKDAPRGFRYDYARRFGDQAWRVFKAKSPKRQLSYTPNRAGTFRFRSRVYNAKGTASGWSTPATLAVSS